MRYYLYYKRYEDIKPFLSKKDVVDIHTYTGFISDKTVLHDSYVRILDLALTIKEYTDLKKKFEIQEIKPLKPVSLVDFYPEGQDPYFKQPQPNPWARVVTVPNVSRDEYYYDFATLTPFITIYSFDGPYETGHIRGTKRLINSNHFYHQVVNLWDRGFTGKGVKICVIDSGYSGNIPHRDIEVVSTYNSASSDNKEFIDDQHTFQMISLMGGRNKPEVPGIIGSAYNAEIYAASFYNPGASMSWGFQQGCKIFNCSFDAGEPDLYWSRTIQKISDDGGVVIAAAGNGRSVVYQINSLAAHPYTVSVAGLVGGNNVKFQEAFYTKNIAPASNGKTLDFAIPHWAIAATIDPGISEPNIYKVTGGSSSAASQLSGIYALLFERYPNLSGKDLTNMLKKYGKKFTDLGVTAIIPQLNW